jgi:hypothetical protein
MAISSDPRTNPREYHVLSKRLYYVPEKSGPKSLVIQSEIGVLPLGFDICNKCEI